MVTNMSQVDDEEWSNESYFSIIDDTEVVKGTVQVLVSSNIAKTKVLNVARSIMIEKLKEIIWDIIGIPESCQILKVANRILNDGQRLIEYNI